MRDVGKMSRCFAFCSTDMLLEFTPLFDFFLFAFPFFLPFYSIASLEEEECEEKKRRGESRGQESRTQTNNNQQQGNFYGHKKRMTCTNLWPSFSSFNTTFSFPATGTPVNRIPIMAKQVLDLYELYNLVVERGGLVEVINKKIWREITKGLNLPSSITSAAFTLRTQ